MFHEYYRFVLCHVFYVKCHAEITRIAQPTRDGGRCAAPHRTHFVALRRCTSTIRAAGRGLLALVGTPSLHTPQRERERERERKKERETALPTEHTFFFCPQSPSGSPRTSFHYVKARLSQFSLLGICSGHCIQNKRTCRAQEGNLDILP